MQRLSSGPHMDNTTGIIPSISTDVSPSPPTKSFLIPEELDEGPGVEPNYNPSQLHINVALKDRSAVPPLNSPRIARAQLHATPHFTNVVSFALFDIETAGSRVTPIDVDNSPLPEPPVSEHASVIELDDDPISTCVARVLEIVPDVEPDHLTELVTREASTHGSGVLEHVLHVLFEDSKYPKIDPKGKGKRKHEDDKDMDMQAGSSKRPKVDFGYGDLSRAFKGGPDYLDLALVWNLFHRYMYTFRSEAGTSTRRLPFPPQGVSERIS